MELYYLENNEELSGGEFLQSRVWGEILRATGSKVRRVGVRDPGSLPAPGKILATATLVKKPLIAGWFYWYAPRGPIFKEGTGLDRRELEKWFFREIKKLEPRALFFRIEPIEKLGSAPAELFRAGRFWIKKTVDLQPATTLILDLEPSEEKLLAGMHQKTRYNIHLAEKKGVIVKEVIRPSEADLAEFWRLMKLTGARDDFRLHKAKHYQNLLASGEGFIRLFFAVYKGKNIAAGLFSFWGDRVTYLHGASDNEFRQVMAPYLLQWAVIKRARAAQFKSYDFYGIDAKKWPGVTRFKLGFGGRTVSYPGTQDVVFQPVGYGVYNWLRKIRRLI